jgi:hypothetical protein
MHQSKENLYKSTLKDRLDSMFTQRRKNVENKTKVEAIERLLSNNKRLRASYVLIRKSCVGMAILPAGAGIRGYPTRRARIRADIFTRGRGFGRTFSLAGS